MVINKPCHIFCLSPEAHGGPRQQATRLRSTHILLLDNSPLNTSRVTQRVLSHIRVPKLITAPASNDCLPVESPLPKARTLRHQVLAAIFEHGQQPPAAEIDVLKINERLNEIPGEKPRRILSQSFCKMANYLDLSPA